MFVLGLQGSPRKKGNTHYLLSQFLSEAEKLGAKTHIIEVDKKNIVPCKEYIVCEKKGFCPIDDDMTHEIYPLLRRAEVIVAATPVFFYNATAQLKALFDRSQTLWARKYRLNLTDPGRKVRRGFLLSVGATKGKNLFEGLNLTVKYFFDAVGASFDGSLTYRRIEHAGDMQKHPTVREDVKEAVHDLLEPLLNRKKILFVCSDNAGRSQMASAFAQYLAGDKFDVICAGNKPSNTIDPVMVEAMHEKGIDMAFRKTRQIDEALSELNPDRIVTIGSREGYPMFQGITIQDWDLPDPAGKSIEVMRDVRDEIEKKVTNLIERLGISTTH